MGWFVGHGDLTPQDLRGGCTEFVVPECSIRSRNSRARLSDMIVDAYLFQVEGSVCRHRPGWVMG